LHNLLFQWTGVYTSLAIFSKLDLFLLGAPVQACQQEEYSGDRDFLVVNFQITHSEEKFSRWGFADVREDVGDGERDDTGEVAVPCMEKVSCSVIPYARQFVVSSITRRTSLFAEES